MRSHRGAAPRVEGTVVRRRAEADQHVSVQPEGGQAKLMTSSTFGAAALISFRNRSSAARSTAFTFARYSSIVRGVDFIAHPLRHATPTGRRAMPPRSRPCCGPADNRSATCTTFRSRRGCSGQVPGARADA